MIKDKNAFNILVIEDNPGDFTLVEDYLTEQIFNPEIVHAESFRNAAAILSNENNLFDVILLDLSLPDKSGKFLVTEMLKINRDTPLIILTGYADVDFSIESISLGVSDYLLKDDLNPTSLYKSIVYCMERRKRLHELKESENRYSTIFNLSPQPMWMYDAETFRFVQVNETAVELYGYSEAEFLDMKITDIICENDLLGVKASFKQQNNDNGVIKGRFRQCKKNNEEIEVELFSSPITLNDKGYISVIAIDITEKIVLQQKIIDQKIIEQKEITKAVVSAQEKERAAIGEELHDNVNQLLAASKLYLGHGLTHVDNRNDILKSQEYIMTAMNEIRKLSHVLVGPTENKTVGLIEPIEELISSMAILKDIKFTFNHANYNEEESEVGLRLVIYRIIQEQVSNILKYAGASKVNIEILKEDAYLIVTIEDNGKGFDSSLKSKGIGLKNITNRAGLYNGVVQIRSSPGKGCKMQIIFEVGNMESDLLKSNPDPVIIE